MIWPNPPGFDHDAWMRLNSPLTATDARLRGLCPTCGGNGRLYWSYADEHGFVPCECQRPSAPAPGNTPHLPTIVSHHSSRTGWTYQVRCTCGLITRTTPHRARAADDRATHIQVVAAPEKARCTTPGLHGHPWWEQCPNRLTSTS